MAKPKDPAIKNKIFLGWYEDKALTIPYDFASKVQSNITLYAGWRSREPVKPDQGDNKILGIEAGREYVIGAVLDFTAVGAGMDNEFPIENDERYVPKSWSVNPSGTWSNAPYTASFETKGMDTGTHILVITFALERYEGGTWKDLGNSAEAKISFVLAEGQEEPTPPVPGEEEQKPTPPVPGEGGVADGETPLIGDRNDLWTWILLAMLPLIGGCAVIIVKKRHR